MLRIFGAPDCGNEADMVGFIAESAYETNNRVTPPAAIMAPRIALGETFS